MTFRPNVDFDRKWISDTDFFSAKSIAGEEWRSFDCFNGVNLRFVYKVSNKGRLKKSDNSLVKGSIDYDGYHGVGLARNDSNSYLYVRVHQLVLSIFAGPPPESMINPTVQHINHNKLDNRIENLCWMSAFDNNQEGHATRCKIIDESGEHVFNSLKFASIYIGRYEDYVAECIREGYKITNVAKSEVTIFTEIDGQWVRYIHPLARNRTKCKLVTDNITEEFESYQACSRFLSKPEGYISNCILNSWPILANVEHKFYIYNQNLCIYELYVPATVKKKNFAARCQLTSDEGLITVFPSISAAARSIGRSSEYLRMNIKNNKVIQDNAGNVVTAIILN